MDPRELKQKLQMAFDFFAGELTKLRTGRASSLLVENLEVEAYDAKMHIKELASVSVPDAQTVIIAPWDKSLLSVIDKVLRESTLGVNPVTGSESIKVPIPPLTEDRRKELAKVVGTKVEDTKNVMRNVRQEAMKVVEKAFVDKEIGEDDKFSRKEAIEKLVKDFVAQVEALADVKREELMHV
jgi:ribosome recycling factor